MVKTSGRANITKLPSGSYRWRKYVELPDGTVKRLSGTCKKRADAEKAMFQAFNEALHGLPVDLKKLTVADLVREHIEAERHRWAPATLSHNQGWLERHIAPEIGQVKAIALSPNMLRDFYKGRSDAGLGSSALNQIKCLLSGAYKRGVRQQFLRSNPIPLQPIYRKKIQEAKKVKLFSVEEAMRLNALAKNDRFGMLLSFLLLTGVRIGEACGLHWTDLEQRVSDGQVKWGIHIRRTRSERNGQTYEGPPKSESGIRFIYVSEEVIDLLKRVKAEQEREAKLHDQTSPHIFLSTTGCPLAADTARGVMHRLCQDAQVRILSPHALRHTFASILISRGMQITQVSQHLGHKDIQITLKYYRHLFEAEKEAVTLSLDAPESMPPENPIRRSRKPRRSPVRKARLGPGEET